MSYVRAHEDSFIVSGSVSVSYPASEHGGRTTAHYSEQVVIRTNIHVDTDPLDRSVEEYEGKITNSEEIENLPVYVSVETKEGQVIEKEVLYAPGSKGKPLNIEEYIAKWSDCLSFACNNEVDNYKRNKINSLFQQGVEMEKPQ